MKTQVSNQLLCIEVLEINFNISLRFGHLMRRSDSFEKTLMLGKIEGGKTRGTTEDEMVGWRHQLSGHEFE